METEKDISNLQKDSDSTLIPIFILVGVMLDIKTIGWEDN